MPSVIFNRYLADKVNNVWMKVWETMIRDTLKNLSLNEEVNDEFLPKVDFRL